MTDNIVQLIRQRFLSADAVAINGPDLRVANPKLKRGGDLGEAQLRWCREKLSGFASHERQAEAARAHSELTKARS